MFRVLPYQGGDPRQISEVVNNLMNGKSNNTGTITLATGNATTTTLIDERISVYTKIILIPFSDAAEADSAPYGAFQDTTDQTATTTNEYIISYNTTDYSNGVSVESTNKIRVKSYGIYNIAFSIQFANTDVGIQDVDIWFKKGSGSGAASNIAGSNSKFSVPNSHGGTDGHLIAALNFFIELQADDYVQLAWASTDSDCKIEHLAAQTSPTRPATPSVILTVNYVAPSAYSNIYVSAQQQGQATITHFSNATANKTYAYILVG
jgi:hypothetical protein